MANLKALRKKYQEEVETVAKTAKTANFDYKVSQISHFSRVLHDENKEELQFLRDERAAIREYDGGMPRSRVENQGIFDLPCLPSIDERSKSCQ